MRSSISVGKFPVKSPALRKECVGQGLCPECGILLITVDGKYACRRGHPINEWAPARLKVVQDV